ncbi:hypothetical protein ACFE04_010261 [Oxalis oulophora]
MTSRDKKVEAKQEGGNINNIDEATRLFSSKATSSNSSRQWSSAFRNPRIVRVSRSFGGKDRHSKVCTIRGLRDRRIRLSVPTAIQLYELQDRLGLGQPSKVIDWLMDSTKDDIDNLPPLQIPQLGFGQFESSPFPNSLAHPSLFDPSFRNSLVPSKELGLRFKGVGINDNDQESSNPSATLFNNGIGSFPYHWDPSNLSLSSSSTSSQYGGGINHGSYAATQGDNSFPNSMGSQYYFSPPQAPPSMPSLFPTYAHYYDSSSSSSSSTTTRITQNTVNNFQFLSSGNPSDKLPFSLNPNHHPDKHTTD